MARLPHTCCDQEGTYKDTKFVWEQLGGKGTGTVAPPPLATPMFEAALKSLSIGALDGRTVLYLMNII